MKDISRRDFLLGACALGGTLILQSKLSFAFANTDQRLMVVILRGGMDGLGAIAPVGDKNYHDARGALALPDNVLLPMGGIFAMHQSMQPLHDLYQKKEMIVLHATATPYRERSHFDAQDLLENGTAKPHGLSTGWLGRSIKALGGDWQGLVIGSTVPLMMQGSKAVQSWSPSHLPQVDDDFLSRVGYMYQHDPILSSVLNDRLNPEAGKDADRQNGKMQFMSMMKSAAGFLSQAKGPRIATIDVTGWDTHAGQGTANGRLPQALATLSEGIAAFRTGMGPMWKNTVVVAVTEFGRTVHVNGTNGTDHGTGGTAFLLGGNVSGGRVIGDWPGLASNNLYEERDLYPANDTRSLLKSVMMDHLHLPENQLDSEIFPGSNSAKAFRGLFI